MHFSAFFKRLAELKPSPRVEVEQLRQIVNQRHTGVGSVTFRYFADFPGAQWGNFIWLEEERTSPHEEPFNDAVIFINDRFSEDRSMRRIIGAKELMHVFDTSGQRAGDAESFRRLLSDIASKPMDGASEPYGADRIALWKATVALVPPWLREEYLEQWNAQAIKAHELAARWWLPETVVAAAMGSYYPAALEMFGIAGEQ